MLSATAPWERQPTSSSTGSARLQLVLIVTLIKMTGRPCLLLVGTRASVHWQGLGHYYCVHGASIRPVALESVLVPRLYGCCRLNTNQKSKIRNQIVTGTNRSIPDATAVLHTALTMRVRPISGACRIRHISMTMTRCCQRARRLYRHYSHMLMNKTNH